jgi:hypothetical protein
MNVNIKKVLWFDLETVGQTATYEDLERENPRMSILWKLWQDKYKETNGNQTLNELWENKAGLHAEYGKVVCASFGYYDKDMNPKMSSFYGHDEKDILINCMGVMNNADKNGMYLGGHTICNFDVPYLWKRMLANGINPPDSINVWDKKPWDLKFFDISKVWSDGSWKESFTSLDTMCAVFGVDTPKGELKGSMVHHSYWRENGIENIKKYCESDVIATMSVGNKLIEITSNKKQHESIMY